MNSSLRYLIVNADDFGMSQEVNQGIKSGIKAGVITSVSVMVNMPFFKDAIQFLKKNPQVSVGLHFNITEGAPRRKPKYVASLLREDNNFFHWISLTIRCLLNQCSFDEIATELDAQYLRLKKTGIHITHIDSHHHIHLFPPIFKLLLQLTQKEKIPFLRCRTFSYWSITNGIYKKPTIKQLAILIFYFINTALSPKYKHLFKIRSIYDVNWDPDLPEERLLKITRVSTSHHRFFEVA